MEHLGFRKKLASIDRGILPAVVESIEEPWYGNMPAEQYHSNTTRMSSSGIRKVLESPLHFLSWIHGQGEDDSPFVEPDHYRFGRALHMMLLEPDLFKKLFVMEPIFEAPTKDGKMSRQSAAAKELKKKWYAELDPAAVVLSEEELGHMMGGIESILAHPVAKGMLADGVPELTFHWTDPDTLVQCKGRADFLVRQKHSGLHLLDVKTTRNVREGLMSYATLDYGYNVQLAYYFDGIREAFGEQPQSITLIVVEKKPPYECAVYVLDDDWYNYGRQAYKDALKIYRKAFLLDKWPARQQSAGLLHPPSKIHSYETPEFSFGEGDQ